ncbi:helix-turn-helix domain-containing protein [Micromonospora sp. DT231]|uniref:helix-turn-helix domain-containing protein n=1 Tax=Micromonospora sp. DT231 TaxID=3416526 RepID=UPI003CEB1878
MAARGRPKAELILSERERRTLEEWAAWTSGDRLALRARIVLASAEGLSNKDVATKVEVGAHTAGKWRARFVDRRLSGLRDEPRPGAGRRITAAQIDAVVIWTLQTAPPAGAGLWSTRAMAAVAGLNQTAVSRLWRAAGLRPHQVATWRLFQDPCFAEAVRSVAGLRIAAGDRILALAAERGRPGSAAGRNQAGPGAGRDQAGPGAGRGQPGPGAGRDQPGPGAGRDQPESGPGRRSLATRAGGDPRCQRLLDVIRAMPLTPAALTPGAVPERVLDFFSALDARVPREWDVHVAWAGQSAREHPEVRTWLRARPRFQLHPVPAAESWHRLLQRWVGRLDRPGDLDRLATVMGAWSGEPIEWFPSSPGAGGVRPPVPGGC